MHEAELLGHARSLCGPLGLLVDLHALGASEQRQLAREEAVGRYDERNYREESRRQQSGDQRWQVREELEQAGAGMSLIEAVAEVAGWPCIIR